MGKKKRESFFFSPSLFSFLPFRLDTNEEKEKIYLAHSSTTINKSRKKRRNRREKRAQKISSLTRRISLPQRRREEKIVPTYTHTHTYASFFRFLLPQFNQISIRDENLREYNYTYTSHVIAIIITIKKE